MLLCSNFDAGHLLYDEEQGIQEGRVDDLLRYFVW